MDLKILKILIQSKDRKLFKEAYIWYTISYKLNFLIFEFFLLLNPYLSLLDEVNFLKFLVFSEENFVFFDDFLVKKVGYVDDIIDLIFRYECNEVVKFNALNFLMTLHE